MYSYSSGEEAPLVCSVVYCAVVVDIHVQCTMYTYNVSLTLVDRLEAGDDVESDLRTLILQLDQEQWQQVLNCTAVCIRTRYM